MIPVIYLSLIIAIVIVGISVIRSDEHLDLAKAILIICAIALGLFAVVTTTFFVQFKEDSVVIKQKAFSFKNKTGSPFKKRIILHKDIKSISVGYREGSVTIQLHDGVRLWYNFSGYFKSSEILEKFSKIQCGNNE